MDNLQGFASGTKPIVLDLIRDDLVSTFALLPADEQALIRDRLRKRARDTTTLLDDGIEYLVEAYLCYDLDGNGSIEEGELKSVLKSIGTCSTDAEVRRLMKQLGTNKDGAVPADNFFRNIGAVQQAEFTLETEDDLKEAFQTIGYENSGAISARELMQLYLSVGEKISLEQAIDMIRIASNGDDKVNFSAFAALLKSQ